MDAVAGLHAAKEKGVPAKKGWKGLAAAGRQKSCSAAVAGLHIEDGPKKSVFC